MFPDPLDKLNREELLMDFLPSLLGRVLGPERPVEKYLMLHNFWDSVEYVITYTRSYRDGLEFADRCDVSNAYFLRTGRITHEQFERLDRNTILLRLSLYDRLDYWRDYIEYFERIRTDKPYLIKRWKHYPSEQDVSYIVRKDEESVYLHFLFVQRSRYELIKRKLDRFSRGLPLGHMRHRPPGELSEEEVEERFRRAMERVTRTRVLMFEFKK